MRALGLSVLLTVLFLPELAGYTDQYTISELVPHIISMGLILWEPLFVHGWLQIRYERAFGTIPAILFATAIGILFIASQKSSSLALKRLGDRL